MHHSTVASTRSLLVTALLAFVAATAVLGGTFSCEPTMVLINTIAARPRLNIQCSNAQKVDGDVVSWYAFLMSTETDREYAQMMTQVASVAKVNGQSIFINYNDAQDSDACVAPAICRSIVTVGL